MYRYNITDDVVVFNSKAKYIENCYCDEVEQILIGDVVCESGFIAYNAYYKYEDLPDGKMEYIVDKVTENENIVN